MRAHGRGVKVRVITDNARMGDPWVGYLRGSGIVVWSDSGSSGSSNYMHHKFALRDLADADSTNDWLWNSSYNPNDGELNADYALEIPCSDLARAFRLEFEQMWGDTGPVPDPTRARFHRTKTDVLPTHEFTVNGQRARLYFSPQDWVVDTITAVAAAARCEVGFAVNAFTYDDLGLALLDQHWTGIRVFGTFDRANAGDPASEFWRLRPAGVPVLIDSYPFGSGTVHEKVMVIDSAIVIVGSANWSNNANFSNDENTLVLYDPVLAARFLAEIVARYREAGGTYPPAVAEPVRAEPLIRTSAPATPRSPRLPVLAYSYDVLGRRFSGRAGPGVYFIPTLRRRLYPVVVLH
jgi:phosphatidylserine/phosphatidylglycerophosphate/cardiolipin synthase-like enzyme